jgi:hypothetical protein
MILRFDYYYYYCYYYYLTKNRSNLFLLLG